MCGDYNYPGPTNGGTGEVAILVNWHLIAGILWTMLVISLGLSAWGVAAKSWPALAVAAVLSGVFSFFGMLSIGLFTFVLITCPQVAGAIWCYRTKAKG